MPRKKKTMGVHKRKPKHVVSTPLCTYLPRIVDLLHLLPSFDPPLSLHAHLPSQRHVYAHSIPYSNFVIHLYYSHMLIDVCRFSVAAFSALILDRSLYKMFGMRDLPVSTPPFVTRRPWTLAIMGNMTRSEKTTTDIFLFVVPHKKHTICHRLINHTWSC